VREESEPLAQWFRVAEFQTEKNNCFAISRF
jgi:hypothetical protein